MSKRRLGAVSEQVVPAALMRQTTHRRMKMQMKDNPGCKRAVESLAEYVVHDMRQLLKASLADLTDDDQLVSPPTSVLEGEMDASNSALIEMLLDAHLTEYCDMFEQLLVENLKAKLINEEGQFWVFGEDLASAMVGPFASKQDAEKHIEFCRARGDGAEMRVVETLDDYNDLIARKDPMLLLPEEDPMFRKFSWDG